MVHHTDRQRWLAVVAYYKGSQNYGFAAKAFLEFLQPTELPEFQWPEQFIRDVMKKFWALGDITDQYPSSSASNPKVVPDDKVDECAIALKKGYVVQVPVVDARGNVTTHPVHRYYTSINQACRENRVLAAVIRQYDVTPQHLLRRMHQQRPELVRRVVEFKHELTDPQREERRTVASQMLDMWRNDPKALLGIWWCDETAMWVISSGTKHQHVYCDAHDEGVRTVLTSPHLAPNIDIKLHFFGAVNAVSGAAFCDFTTGTTDIQRLHPLPRAPYKTKASGYTEPAKSTTTREFEDLIAVMVEEKRPQMQALGLDFKVSWDNVKFQRVADLKQMGLEPREKLTIPRYSPDLHKAIEHPWAEVKRLMQEQLLQPRAEPLTAREAQRLMVQCFQQLDTGSIFRDVCSLPVTCFVIQGDEGHSAVGPDGQEHVCCGGGWPTRRYR